MKIVPLAATLKPIKDKYDAQHTGTAIFRHGSRPLVGTIKCFVSQTWCTANREHTFDRHEAVPLTATVNRLVRQTWCTIGMERNFTRIGAKPLVVTIKFLTRQSGAHQVQNTFVSTVGCAAPRNEEFSGKFNMLGNDQGTQRCRNGGLFR